MKKLGLGILSLFWLFTSCISDSENTQAILERDIKKIEEYLIQNPVASIKELNDPSGVRIFWQEVSGSAKKPETMDSVFVDYVGKFFDGRVFDTSIESVARENNIFSPQRPYRPFGYVFGVGQTIPGFDFAVSQMDEGDKVTVFIPSLYAYGSQGTTGIPRNTPLMFEIKLLRVKRLGEIDQL